MLDYDALAALAAVLREGGFDRAAAALGVTPSAVSQRVRALEERVGAALIARGRPPRPTKAGARLCAHFERVRLLESELGAPGDDAAPALRVAVNADSLATWFPAAAAAFARAQKATLDVVLDDEGHTAERLRSGDALAAVTLDAEPAPGCRIQPLGALRYVAAASPDFVRRRFAHGVTARTLAAAPVLRFDRRDELQMRWARAWFGTNALGPAHFVPATQGFVDCCAAGLGWAMHPRALIANALAQGRLVELAPRKPFDVALHWQQVRLPSAPLEALARAVRAAAGRALV
ncbi:MAG: LysR family transcriptional regulator ArgP [Tagaea sp.]|nr:LysR family transcriptional regulator ArgP [Magnetospirillum sp.]